MKRNALASGILLMLVSGSACHNNNTTGSQTAGDGYTIKGELTNLPSGKVKLMNYNQDDRTSKVLDSTEVVNGSFELKGKTASASMMSLLIEPGNWSIPVFVENSAITVKADTTGAEHYDYRAYGSDMGARIKKFTVSGSENNDDYMSFQNAPGNKRFDDIYAELNKKFDAEKDDKKKEAMRGVFDSLRTLRATWQKNWIDSFATAKPASVAGAFILSNYFMENSKTSIGSLDSMLNKFKSPATGSAYYKSVAKANSNRKALLPGNTAPDFTLLQRDSTPLTLSSTRGKYVMVDFWASWCHPCRQAIPHWKEVYKKYHDKGFDIVSVSDDSRWSDWTKAMDQEKMPWRQVDDEFPIKNMPARVGSLYMTTYIPFYVLLDKEGKILVYTDDEKKIDDKLAELLNDSHLDEPNKKL